MLSHNFPFDPTFGYSLETLLKVQPPAVFPGFEAFWRETYKLALAAAPKPTLRKIQSPREDVELYEVEYSGFDGFRVGGWVTRPVGVKVKRGMVIGHGYGGRSDPDLTPAGPPAVTIQPCARGFHRSARPDLPDNSTAHVIHGITSRETYMHRYCVMDLWSAVSALIEIAPEAADCVQYAGGSFGGGMGAMALPWEPRFKRGFIAVPSFGNHPLRLQSPCVGSGESVRQYYLKHPEVVEVLQYFDSAITAQFCKIPVMAACARFDPAVPPFGQFSVYNALAGEKHLFVREADHFTWEGSAEEGDRLYKEQAEWFAKGC